MTTFLLVRHAAHDNLGAWLAGRSHGVTLGPEGRAQAARLGSRLAKDPISMIVSSPRERAQETAQALARGRGLDVATEDALDEIDFGAWSGRSFDDLNGDPEWRRWNDARLVARTPAGDGMARAQARIVELLLRLEAQVGAAMIALVTHAEPIRAAILYVLGGSLDAWARIDIAPASVSRLVMDARGARLLSVNEGPA